MANPWSLMGNQGGNYFANLNPEPDQTDPEFMKPASISVLSDDSSPLSMTGVKLPGVPGSKKVAQEKTTQDQKSSSTNKKYMDSDQFAQNLATVLGAGGEQNPLAQQMQDVSGMKGLLAAQAQAASGKSHIDLKPLAAWIDSENSKRGVKSDFASAGETPTDDAAGVMQGIQGLQKQHGDIEKEVTSAMKGLSSGSDTNSTNNSQMQMLLSQLGGMMGGGMAGQARLDALRMRAGQSFDNDPVVKAITNTTNSLDRAQSILNGKQPVTAQSLNIAQQDFINSVAAGGAATEGKVDRELLTTLATKINEAKTKFGDFADLRSSPDGLALINQIQGLIGQVRNDYHAAGTDRVNQISNNFGHISDEGVRQTAADKKAAYSQKFAPVTTAPVVAPNAAPAAAAPQSFEEWKKANGR